MKMLCTRFFLFTIVISLETSKVQQNILQQEERFFGLALKKKHNYQTLCSILFTNAILNYNQTKSLQK